MRLYVSEEGGMLGLEFEDEEYVWFVKCRRVSVVNLVFGDLFMV